MYTFLAGRGTHSNKNQGFALIIALSLMAFVLLLLLSITTLVQVETQSADTGKRTMEARMNAQLGLQVAIGEIQRTLGPDARVSANASVLDSDPSTAAIDGIEHSHWLGVYPTVNPTDVNDSLLDPKKLRDWSLERVEWLISREDDTILDPTMALTSDTVTLAQFIDDPTIQIPELDQMGSLPVASLSKAQAELVEIDGGAANSSGRFAWWVGDESMKARVNTQASETGDDVLSGTEIDAEAQQRSNYQVTQGTDFSTWLPGYNDDLNNLYKVLAPNGLESLASSLGNTQWAKWSALNRDKFTPYSQSLPVDVVNGRLKQDLTAYLKGAYTGLDNESMIDFRFALSSESRQPSFDLLKQWSEMVSDIDVAQAVVAPDLNANPVKHGLHPLVTQGSVSLRYAAKVTGTKTMQAVAMILPQIQLWNPHNVDLAAQDYIVQIGTQFDFWISNHRIDANKEFGLAIADSPAISSRDTVTMGRGQINNVQSLPPHQTANVSNESIDYNDEDNGAYEPRFFTFVIKDQAFKAGETLVFYPKPPPASSGVDSGVPYNLSDDADTDILENYTADEELNLLVNQGDLNEFFYIENPFVWTLKSGSTFKLGVDELGLEVNFSSLGLDKPNPNIHLNLYAADSRGNPLLLHALKQQQTNYRTGNWRRPVYYLSDYQHGNIFAIQTMNYSDSLINIGSSLLASNFDIFEGGQNQNLPPDSGQPHAMLGYWNVRNQESFSASDDWAEAQTGQDWLNAFSFRIIDRFATTWEPADNLYSNLSTDRLGGWWTSNVQDMAYPFFDYPTDAYGPLSLGEFQHANLSVYGWQPTFAFGNAQAAPRLQRNEYKSSAYEDLYDVSYLLNASTWDRFYLSSIPQSGASLSPGMRLPNSRQSLSNEMNDIGLSVDEIINDSGFDLSAASVRIDGGFNVNSTSVAAWGAFLSGAIGQSIQTRHDDDTTFASYDIVPSNVATAAPMGRFLSPLLEEPSDVAVDRNTTDFETPHLWASTRTVSESEIQALASRIVEEVKLRGPFLSLADFVNRRIEPDTTDADEQIYHGVLGTLQAAINKVTLEDKLINYHYYDADVPGGRALAIKPADDWVWTDGNFVVPDVAQEAMFGYPKSTIDAEGGLIHNYAPNFLSQADVLTKIGPSVTVRGDTFVIRSYGDSRNPITDEVIAEAWCEAVVQRVAEPVDWDDTPEQLIQIQALDDVVQPNFGRRFKVVSFRWLDKADVQPYSADLAIN